MRRKTEGSIVLEAALILPVFIGFLFLLITFIRIGIVEIALNHAVSNTVKQVSTHFYPADLLYREFSQTSLGTNLNQGVERAESIRGRVGELEDLLKSHSNLFPEDFRRLLTLRESLEGSILNQYDQLLSTIFQPILDHYVDDKLLRLENLYVTKVVLPNLKTSDPAFFGIEVRYDMPLQVPFFNRVVTFKAKGYERVWIGGQSISSYLPKDPTTEGERTEDSNRSQSGESEEKQEDVLLIDSMNSPVQRGRNLRIIARGPPNQRAVIMLYYQSGFVKDKSCTFNATGWLTCDIPIGGHANEGEYKALVKVGRQEATGHFTVLSKANMEKYKVSRIGMR